MATGAVTTPDAGTPDSGSPEGLISSGDAPAEEAAPAEGGLISSGDTAADGKASEEAGEGTAAGSEEAPSGAPEAYADFSLADGIQYSKDQIEGAKGIFKGLNGGKGLTQEDAQALVNFQSEWAGKLSKEHSTASAKALSTVQAGWAGTIRADPDVGGENLVGSRNLVRAALVNVTGGSELESTLKKFGLNDHPVIFKFLVGVGKGLSSDRANRDGPGGGKDQDTPDEHGLTPKTRAFYAEPS
jgi:hypothetical protein